MYCIYKVTNKINNHTYIGQHKYYNENKPLGLKTKRGKYWGSGKILHIAYKKYGKQNFEIEVLYQRIINSDTADSMEIYAISKEKANGHAEYNILSGGQFRRMSSEKFSKRISEGMKKSNAAAKISKAMTGENNHNFGKPALNRGIPATAEAKEKNRMSHLGKKASEETKIKHSKWMKEHHNSGMFQKGQVSRNKGKVYYYDPVNLKSNTFIEGQQPEGWIRGRYTPWQGKWKN